MEGVRPVGGPTQAGRSGLGAVHGSTGKHPLFLPRDESAGSGGPTVFLFLCPSLLLPLSGLFLSSVHLLTCKHHLRVFMSSYLSFLLFTLRLRTQNLEL